MAMCFCAVSGTELAERVCVVGISMNLVTYLTGEMHLSSAKSANIVTNFIGTVFLLSLLGGFLSDSYLGSFWTMLIFGFVELSVSPPITQTLTIGATKNLLCFVLKLYKRHGKRFRERPVHAALTA
jgi:dipeptide/tripeptide permease